MKPATVIVNRNDSPKADSISDADEDFEESVEEPTQTMNVEPLPVKTKMVAPVSKKAVPAESMSEDDFEESEAKEPTQTMDIEPLPVKTKMVAPITKKPVPVISASPVEVEFSEESIANDFVEESIGNEI